MRIKGNGYVHIFKPIDECPHAADPEPLWQESWVVYFWDIEHQVYLFLRLSQEPNRGPGYSAIWLNIWTPGAIYKHTDESVPLAPGDRSANSFSSAGGACRYQYNGDHTWTVNTKDARVHLTIKDDHPGVGYFPESAGAISSEASKNHIEATGWATGSVTIADKTYQVAGTAWRDHSWGKRNWYNMRVHRFYPALFGKELNLFFTTFIGGDAKLVKFGTIIRDGAIEIIRAFDIVVYLGEDGVSNRGGRVVFPLDGKTHVIEHRPQTKTVVSLHQHFQCVDCMCTVSMGGRVGVGVAETSNRSQGGTERPYVAPPNILENGIHPA